MAPLVETVIRQAVKTFTKSPNAPSSTVFRENFENLVSHVNHLTYNDVRLDRSLLVSNTMNHRRAPVTYVEILENKEVTIGIFILRPGAKLPLHDHPLMYGILKVIFGKVSIQSYTLVKKPSVPEKLVEPNGDVSGTSSGSDASSSSLSSLETSDYLYSEIPLLANKHPSMIVSDTDSCCVLTPTERNLHEIRTVDGPAAFIDILSPPYYSVIPDVGPRQCLYFIEVGSEKSLVKLKPVPNQSEYWNDTAPYQGPPINN